MQHFCVYITLFDKLLQTFKLVSRGLRTVSQITASDHILSRKKISDHANELFGHPMESFFKILIPVFLMNFGFFSVHVGRICPTADIGGVGSGQNGVLRSKTALRLSSVSMSHCLSSDLCYSSRSKSLCMS